MEVTQAQFSRGILHGGTPQSSLGPERETRIHTASGGQNRTSDPLKLQSQMAVSHPVGVENETQPF